MSTLARFTLTLAPALAFFGTGAHAQCAGGFFLQPNALQAAIDAAPAGGVVEISATTGPFNEGYSVCIDKPLTLVGLGSSPVTLMVTGSEGIFGFPGECAVIHVAASVHGVVGFRNLKILGAAYHHDGFYQGPTGIRCESPNAAIVLDHCIVDGCDYPFADEFSGSGAPGVSGTVSSLVAVDSTVAGGDAVPKSLGFAGDAGDGIDVLGEVVLVRSTCSGGAGSNTVGYPDCAFPHAPGDGGDAVVAVKVYAWGSVGTGGEPGEALDCSGTPIAFGSPGLGLGANPPATLQVTQQPVLGGSASFAFDNPSVAPVTLGIGVHGWSPAIELPGVGPIFLGPGAILIGSPLGIGSLGVPVPNEPFLIGMHFPVQALVGSVLSNPDTAVILR